MVEVWITLNSNRVGHILNNNRVGHILNNNRLGHTQIIKMVEVWIFKKRNKKMESKEWLSKLKLKPI